MPIALMRRLGVIALTLGLLAPLTPSVGAVEASAVAPRTVEDLLSSTNLLRQGSRGAVVADLQTVLDDLGYDPGPIDGIFGGMTSAAVRAFQGDAGITVDGLVGTGTRAALAAALDAADPDPPAPDDPPADDGTLRPGDRGPEVRDVQVALNALGYDAGPSDGIYGGLTESAVRELQEDQGLVVDGKVGPNTLSTLEELVSIPAAGDGRQPTIRRGNQGEPVALAQRLLTAAGFDVGPADGIFGARTQQMAIAFQAANDLVADGIIGPSTWASLLPIADDLPPPPADDPDCPPVSTTSDHPWRGEPCIERWRPLVQEFFESVDVDPALGVLRCESWGDAGALNPSSDTSGLFQHRPYTFDSSGRRIDLWTSRYQRAVAWWADRNVSIPEGADIFDPETNVAVAAFLVYSEGGGATGWWHWGTFYGLVGCYDWVQSVLAQD